jgi:hypothetical protein
MTTELTRFAVVRTGGFGGLTRSGVLDTRELTPDEARQLADVLDAADLDALAVRQPREAAVPDAFSYELSVSRGGRQWQLALSDAEVPDELRPLIRRALQPSDTTLLVVIGQMMPTPRKAARTVWAA